MGADEAEVTVAVASADAFDPETDFHSGYDQFKDAIVLPNGVFDRLFGPDRYTGYVDAVAHDAPDRQTDPLYAIRFDEGYDRRTADATDGTDAPGPVGAPLAYLRLNQQDTLGCASADTCPLVTVTPVETEDCGPLTVKRDSTYRESTEERVCRVNPSLLAAVGLEPRTTVEVVSSTTYGRIHLELRTSDTVSEDCIALSTHARKLLGVKLDYKTDDEAERTVTLRHPHAERADRSLPERLAEAVSDRFVGYNEIQLRTIIGLNADENRDVVRADRETLDILGIEAGDRVVLESFSQRATARCLPLDNDAFLVEDDDDLKSADINPTTVLLPSTERDEVGVVVDDVVSVRRDMLYVTGKRVFPSILGILGVFLAGLQALGLADLGLTDPNVLVAVVASFFGVSLLMIWVVLWPERQKCSL